MRALASDWLNLRLYGSSLTFSIFMRMEFNQAIDSNRINQFLRHFNVFDVQVLYFLLWSSFAWASFAQMVQHHFDVLIKYIISSMEKKIIPICIDYYSRKHSAAKYGLSYLQTDRNEGARSIEALDFILLHSKLIIFFMIQSLKPIN